MKKQRVRRQKVNQPEGLVTQGEHQETRSDCVVSLNDGSKHCITCSHVRTASRAKSQSSPNLDELHRRELQGCKAWRRDSNKKTASRRTNTMWNKTNGRGPSASVGPLTLRGKGKKLFSSLISTIAPSGKLVDG